LPKARLSRGAFADRDGILRRWRAKPLLLLSVDKLRGSNEELLEIHNSVVAIVVAPIIGVDAGVGVGAISG
jgi:hypothetical protein